MPELAVLLIIGAGTYLMRAVFLLTAGQQPPRMLTRFLPHVGPAVLAAITAPMLLAPQGSIALTASLPSLAAAAATWGLWARTRRLPVALLGGLLVWWVVLAASPA